MRPAYPPATTDEAGLLAACSAFLEMSEPDMLALVPPQGGFFFQDCPNCDQGGEDYELAWELSLGRQHVRCRYCEAILPSEKYPEDGELSMPMPSSGAAQVFRYHQNEAGHKYFFEARRWFEQRELLQRVAYNLAQLHAVDPDRHADAGRRAALILSRFTELYPDYILRFDYPHREKKFFVGNDVSPAAQIADGPYRIAKWSWWAYMDVSDSLLRAYDLLRANAALDEQQQRHIESQLFGPMLDFVAQYDGTELNNMHPTLWNSRIIASRVLDRPALAEQCLAEMKQLIAEQFTYDGIWREGTPSYHLQTAGGLQYGLRLLRPDLDAGSFDAWLAQAHPMLSRALGAVELLRLPNGHYAAIHDSHAEQKSPLGPGAAPPALLPGMGYATLSSGSTADDALQAHLKFSGRFGHEHYDSLSLLLFASGRELISDIGYTHTKARSWTAATASHNTVVVDQLNQPSRSDPRRGMGSVRLFDVSDPSLQIVQAEVNDAYPNVTTLYGRTLVSVGVPGEGRYVIDIFDVEGGRDTHDWILHGSADQPQTIQLTDAHDQPIDARALESFLPAGQNVPRSQSNIDFSDLQGPAAYAYFRDILAAQAKDTFIATYRFDDDPQRGHRTWLLGSNRPTKVFAARSWAVRGTGPAMNEDESKLDQRLRASLIVRRDAPANRFVAVHQPLPSDNAIVKVSRMMAEPSSLTALKIELSGGQVDYFVYAPPAKAQWHARDGTNKLSGDARIAWARDGGAMKLFDGAFLSFNQRRLAGQRAATARLRQIDGNRLTLEGNVLVEPNQVIVVEHGDGTTSGFHVLAVERADTQQTVITTVEPPVLQGDASGDLTMLTFPHLTLPPPHHVRAGASVAATQPSN